MSEKLSERLWRLLNDASERCALNSNELCLLDEARNVVKRLEDAPAGFVVGQSGPDGFFPNHSGAIVQMDDPASVKGKRVRLVTP